MGKERRGQGLRGERKWRGLVALGIVAAVTACMVAFAVAKQSESIAATVSAPRWTPSATTATPAPPKTQLVEVLPRLRDAARPFNVVVFSDSTGAGRETWTAKTGGWLGEKYNRTVQGYQWDIHADPNGYSSIKWNLSSGSGAPVTWWNGASAGKDAVYSLEHINEIAPIPAGTVDLVFISHGHNHDNGELRAESPALIREAEKRFTNAAIVIVMQNPEKAASPHRAVQEHGVKALGQFARDNNFPVIDVFTPFSAQDVEALIDDTLYHPTEVGYQFWADIVTAELDAADPY